MSRHERQLAKLQYTIFQDIKEQAIFCGCCGTVVVLRIRNLSFEPLGQSVYYDEYLPVWPDAEIKSRQFFSKSCPKISHSWFYFKKLFFKRAQKVTVHLGYFWNKICSQELSKITQFGHTGGNLQSNLYPLNWDAVQQSNHTFILTREIT